MFLTDSPISLKIFIIPSGILEDWVMKTKAVASRLAYVLLRWGFSIFLLYKCLKTGLNWSEGCQITMSAHLSCRRDRRQIDRTHMLWCNCFRCDFRGIDKLPPLSRIVGRTEFRLNAKTKPIPYVVAEANAGSPQNSRVPVAESPR